MAVAPYWSNPVLELPLGRIEAQRDCPDPMHSTQT
jgi:hypothetical protein